MPPEIVVRDEEEACAYLPGRRARQPLRAPVRPLTGAEFDARLEAGDRRAGTLLYNQTCPACAACEPIRVDVHAFAPSRSQRRAHAKADAAVTVQLGPIEVDDARLALYRAHERGRGLDRDGRPPVDTIGYESAFAMSCVDGFEVRYVVAGQLAGVAITDRGARALSAVYTFWIRPTPRCRSGPFRSSRRSRSPGAGGSTGSTWVGDPRQSLDGLQARVHAARTAHRRQLAPLRARLRKRGVTPSSERTKRWVQRNS